MKRKHPSTTKPVKNGTITKRVPYANEEDDYSYITRVTQYKNGKRNGPSYETFEPKEGQSKEDMFISKTEAHYVNGKLHGEEKMWRGNGNLLSETPYRQGEIHGVSMVYNEEGEVCAIRTYNRGIRHGAFSEWADDGNLIYEMYYRKGKQHGRYKEMCGEGTKYDGQYVDNKRSGIFRKWYHDGVIEFKRLYVKGEYVKDIPPNDKDVPFDTR